MPVTNNEFNEEQLYKQRLRIALKTARICVFEVDLSRQLYTFFENAEDIFGVSGDTILRDVQPYSELDPFHYQRSVTSYFSHPDDEKVIAEAFHSILSGIPATYEARMRAGGSNYIWCKIDVTPIMENDRAVKMIGVITDITSSKKRADHLMKEVRLDNFTGLYNKKYATLAIEQALAGNFEQKHALVLVDIDNFKVINDTYGHAEGDKVLKAMSSELKNQFRKSDIISRFGGDEYLILIRDIFDTDWLCDKLSKIVKCSHSPYVYTNSIGVSIFPEDALTFEELFLKADKALYYSKNDKACYNFFSSIPEA